MTTQETKSLKRKGLKEFIEDDPSLTRHVGWDDIKDDDALNTESCSTTGSSTGSSTEDRGREFVEVVAEYPAPDLCTYPEYRGKPYYSIHYRENDEDIMGFGTYKPEVLSQYLKEYFMPSVEPKIKPCTAEYQRVYMKGWNEGRRKLVDAMEKEIAI